MRNNAFQYALMPRSLAGEPADWLLDDDSTNYKACDILDFPDELRDDVYSQYQSSYKNVNKDPKPQLVSKANELLEYNRWILFYEDGDLEKNVICFCLYKKTEFGLKAALGGSNGTQTGKRCLLTFKSISFNTNGVFGEVSGPLKKRIIRDVPVVSFNQAKLILEQLGKTDLTEGENNHYSRNIGPLGRVEKIMVGKPIVNDD